MRNFFISYSKADKHWAEWIAWELEEEGYTTILQAWDFRPSQNFVIKMNQAINECERTIAVLSPDYINAVFTQPEWTAAFAQDPTNEKGILLPVRVRECELKGLINQIIYIDLVGKNEAQAKATLLEGIQQERAKPLTKPDYPGSAPRSIEAQPAFPGKRFAPRWLIAVAGVSLIVFAALALSMWLSGRTSPEVEKPVHAPAVWERAYLISGERIAYASPEATYQVLRKRLEAAEHSILIGVYDFSSPPVKDLLLSAMKRGVRVSLLVNPGSSIDEEEDVIINELAHNGADVVKATVRGSSPLPIYRPKFIVIDGQWTIVQSGNLTTNSVPVEGLSGNRGMGIAIQSNELAGFFAGLFDKDIKMARAAAADSSDNETPERESTYTPYEPVKRFPAFSIGGSDAGTQNTNSQMQPAKSDYVLPVLTPENYLEVMKQILASAKESIEIYQQIINPGPNVQKLLDSVKAAQAANPKLKIRIILAPPVLETQGPPTLSLLDGYGWHLGENVRFMKQRSTNKLVIVDRRVSLVGSAHWTNVGVSRSREVCLLVDSPLIAGYYAQIFETDWNAALSSLNRNN